MDLLVLLIVILVVAWLCGLAFSIGPLIHLLLLVALVIVVIRLAQGRSAL